MEDLSELELDLDDGPNNENADPIENSQRSFKDAYIGFTQRTQRATYYTEYSEVVEPSNDFEALLSEFKCSLRRDDSGNEHIWIDGNFTEFVQLLNKKLSKRESRESLLEKLSQALSNSSKVKLYLTPCNSQKGPQDTIFRALLSCIHTQIKTFNLLMDKMDGFGKTNNADATTFGVACVAQIRFLERIADGPAMVESIFERNIESWSPSVRDSLIEALPEVVTDVACQQDAALSLRDMLLRRPDRDALSFQTVIMKTLRLLRMDGGTAKKIREDLCHSIMQFDAVVLPELVSFLLQTLTYDEKSSLRNVLNDLSSNLNLPALRVERSMRRVTVDDILLEMLSKLKRFVQLEGNKGWKEVIAFLKKSGTEAEEELESNEIYRTFDYFDVLFSISLLSLDSCPPKLITIFKNQASSTLEKYNNFQMHVDFVLKYKKIACQYLSSLIALSQQCLWANNAQIQALGAQIYKKLFLTVTSSRESILQSMKKHLSSTPSEAEAVLSIFEYIIKENPEAFSPFVLELKICLDHLETLSAGNIKRLFSVLIQINHTSLNKYEVDSSIRECIQKLLSSVNEKEQVWGILGIVMQLNHQLSISTSGREENIFNLLEQLKEACTSARLRSVMYLEMTKVIQENMRNEKSNVLLDWVDGLFTSFRQDFFIERENYEPTSPLEEVNRYVNPKTSLWVNTNSSRLVELVPLFQLLRGAALVRQRWTHDDDTLVTFNQHFAQVFFAFDANIVLNSTEISSKTRDQGSLQKTKKSELMKIADTLYLVIEWIRELFNTFESCQSIDWIEPSEMKKVWNRKFRLLMECNEKLIEAIKLVNEWTLPTISSNFADILIVSQVPKRGRKSTGQKKPKRKKKVAEDTDVSDGEEEQSPALRKELFMNKVETVPLANINLYFQYLELGTVVRCLQYMPDKIRGSFFLIGEYTKILKDFNNRITNNQQKVLASTLDSKSHSNLRGDVSHSWKNFIKGACEILSILDKVVVHLRENDSDADNKTKELLKECISAFCVLGNVLNDSNNNFDGMRVRKRNQFMEQFEKIILTFKTKHKDDPSQEEAEKTFLKYFISIADVICDFEVAVLFVQSASYYSSWTDKLRKDMARITLEFLKKEWVDGEGESVKVSPKSVATLLEIYISFRNEEDRLNAILWLLANKFAELVPDEERRKSKMSTHEEIKDPGFTKKDKEDVFNSFTRHNAPQIYRVFFNTLCSIIQKRIAPREALQLGQITVEKIISQWKVAANIFTLLCLIIRVKELRNAFLLQSALKEGKRFLFLFSKNSSFMYILEDNVRFSAVASDAIGIIKTVQLGNRSLQNISVFAKANMRVSLLKGLPELRANSELWMRSVHTAIVNLGCEEAFEIGLLKSRDIDGEEIVVAEEEESQTSGEESEVY